MRKFIQTALAFLLALITNLAHAEIYMNFLPADSLTKIQEKYPNGRFEDSRPAWLLPNEGFKKLTGAGISGEIYLKFSTSDAVTLAAKNRLLQKIAANHQGDNSIDQKMVDMYTYSLELPIDSRLTLDWVRWIPPAALPFERIKSKYGNPDKCGFDDDTFEPFCYWTNRKINATLNDTKSHVIRITFGFTDNEFRAAMGL